MNFYINTHPYYCGIDLHTRLLYVCIIDNENNILVHKKSMIHPINCCASPPFYEFAYTFTEPDTNWSM